MESKEEIFEAKEEIEIQEETVVEETHKTEVDIEIKSEKGPGNLNIHLSNHGLLELSLNFQGAPMAKALV